MQFATCSSNERPISSAPLYTSSLFTPAAKFSVFSFLVTLFTSASITLREGRTPSAELRDELREFVAEKIGAIARPDDVLFTADLPKTRSGKIMRRLLRDIAEGRALGDTTTLADPNVVNALKEQYEATES